MKKIIKSIRRKLINNSKALPKYYKISEMIEQNKKILDFGCWKGELSNILIKKKNSKVIGCDLIEEPGFKDKNFKYMKVTLENNFPFKEKFDYIIFADVLEHLKDPFKMIREAFKHADKIIVSIPNIKFFIYRIFPKLENPPKDLTPHLSHWTLESFKKELPKEFKIINVSYCSDFPELRWTNYFPFKNHNFFNQTLIMKIAKRI